MTIRNEPIPNKVIPRIPASDEEFAESAENSTLGWKIGRRVSSEQRLIFFDRLWRNNILHGIDSDSNYHKDNPILNDLTESLQHPFEGSGNFGIESILGSEYIPFAYTGGYMFLDEQNQIQMYLAKNTGIKSIPFGDFHDIAAGQYKAEYDNNLRELPNAERCLFFHAYNTANDTIEYFVIPVETLHHEQSQMRLGEKYADQYVDSFNDRQVVDFEKQYSLASYGITRVVLNNSTRRHAVSALLAADQLLPTIMKRMKIRMDYDMEPDQALREAMRERILSQAGVKNSFSRYWSSENDNAKAD